MKIDFLARQAYYIDHLKPIWNSLPERGVFYALGQEAIDRANADLGYPCTSSYPDGGDCGHNPIICASYGDAVQAYEFDKNRPIILLEHGVGFTFGKAAYANGAGMRDRFTLMPVQNKYVLNKVHQDVKHLPHPIIGVPKLDNWIGAIDLKPFMPFEPTICISFHHGDKNSRPAEVGSAWEHYIDILPELAKKHKFIAHVHPMAKTLRQRILECGINIIESFDKVMNDADILINDCSSIAYEFLVTGKPVILLNAPWFDRKANYGLRFWDYTDFAIQVDEPYLLEEAITRTIKNPDEFRFKRQRAVRDLFPYVGEATKKAVQEIKTAVRKWNPNEVEEVLEQPVKKTSKFFFSTPRASIERGILYMAFGKKAEYELEKCIASLRDTGCDLPYKVVTDNSYLENGLLFKGENPFDPSRASNFQFRAGRVKPFFYNYSPFKETLYCDCDLTYNENPEGMFGMLKNWDFIATQERLMVSQLYNRKGAAWQHDQIERDETIKEFGLPTGDFYFWNSGVFLWRKNDKTKELFKFWYSEWMKYKNWDEQKALMRAANKSDAKVFVLPEIYNYPHIDNAMAKIIHLYGRGQARTDVKDVE